MVYRHTTNITIQFREPKSGHISYSKAGNTLRKFKGSRDTQWRGDPIAAEIAANISSVFLIMSTTPDAGADSSGVRQRGEVK